MSSPLVHARVFALALFIMVGLGTALLLTPWATRAGQHTDVATALFTAVSAGTITGFATVDTETHWTRFGQAVILVLIQLGGLGFTVGASLVFQILRREGSLRDALLMRDGAPTLTLREALELSGRIIRFTFALEAAGASLLSIHFWLVADMPPARAIWFGVFHAVCAFCNAGFDLSTGFLSFIPYRDDVLLNVTTGALMAAGCLSFLVFHDVLTQRSWRRLGLDTRLVLVTYAVVLAGSAMVFLAAEWDASLSDTPAWARPMSAVFQAIAARSAGYTTVNFADATPIVLLTWVGVMAIGGASGSTAGGVKLTTTAVVVVAVLAALRGHSEVQVFGRRIVAPVVYRAMAIVMVFSLVYLVAVMALLVSDGSLLASRYTIDEVLFETMSALATTGISTGISAELSDTGLVILSLAMLFGRLGPLSVAYALQRRQSPPRFRYTEEAVRIG